MFTPRSEEIFLQSKPFESRAVRLIQGVVQEIEVERTSQRGLVGNIVMGRVSRILPGMQAAFIDAGFARTGFCTSRMSGRLVTMHKVITSTRRAPLRRFFTRGSNFLFRF